MPAGFERLNGRQSQPNSRIVFIKPLPGSDEATAKDFLSRVAAQCFPIMRDNGIYVTSLEQYEFNREFVGRNFNAGEVIQLVLKARSGHWLPFDYVQMVMMHELAHCKQMNHSKAFWAVRNSYAEQVRKLWVKGYTGEGLWGRGTLLTTGEFERNTVRPDEPLPEHLCGGTYASRKRQRKGKGPTKLSAEERKAGKERRILKKFGPRGQALGADEEIKTSLENRRGKKATKPAPKPRVAGSNRGRELRASAALARFDQVKTEDENTKVEVVSDDDEDGIDSESESDGDDACIIVDINGKKLVDGKGRGMVRVCSDECKDDQDSRDELRELQRFRSFGLQKIPAPIVVSKKTPWSASGVLKTEPQLASNSDNIKKGSHEDSRNDASASNTSNQVKTAATDKLSARPTPKLSSSSFFPSSSAPRNIRSSSGTSVGRSSKPKRTPETNGNSGKASTDGRLSAGKATTATTTTTAAAMTVNKKGGSDKKTSTPPPPPPLGTSGKNDCPVCSFVNDGGSAICCMCSNVLKPSLVPGTWRCRGSVCDEKSKYLNAGDYGVCGLCGAKRTLDGG